MIQTYSVYMEKTIVTVMMMVLVGCASEVETTKELGAPQIVGVEASVAQEGHFANMGDIANLVGWEEVFSQDVINEGKNFTRTYEDYSVLIAKRGVSTVSYSDPSNPNHIVIMSMYKGSKQECAATVLEVAKLYMMYSGAEYTSEVKDLVGRLQMTHCTIVRN